MKINRFDTAEQLENNLAQKIREDLHVLIREYGRATLLVSGGSSPLGLYRKLARHKLPWKEVNLALVDERFVPTGDPASNELSVRTHLLQENAAAAHFTGLVHDPGSAENNLRIAREQYHAILRGKSHLCILGMGTDGHTASLFPGDPASEKDLNESTEPNLILTQAPASPYTRISCNKQLIINSKKIYLLISGKEKLELLPLAEEQKLPVAHFLPAKQTETYYSEEKL